MVDETERLRTAVRTQEAVLRAMADQLQREAPASEQLRGQTDAESARLVCAMAALSRARVSSQAGPERPPSHPPDPRGRKPRVLVVDDDDAARDAVETWLAQAYEVVTARDGVEGLDRAREALPDAVIADVEMPRMDGIEMAEQIRALSAAAAVPILFLTAHSAPENVTAGFSAGGVGFLVKPVDLELLDEELQWALGSPEPADPPASQRHEGDGR